MKTFYNYILFLVLVFQVACSSICNSELSPIEFIHWMRQNIKSFTHEKEIGNYRFKLQFLPVDYKVLLEVDNINSITTAYYNSRDSVLNRYQSCNLTIYPINKDKTLLETDATDEGDYGARLNYFSNYAQNDIYLIQGNDTLHCLVYHFENTYGLQKHNTINLMFEKPNQQKGDIEFVFTEKILNTGTIRFTQDVEKLKSVPKLKLD